MGPYSDNFFAQHKQHAEYIQVGSGHSHQSDDLRNDSYNRKPQLSCSPKGGERYKLKWLLAAQTKGAFAFPLLFLVVE